MASVTREAFASLPTNSHRAPREIYLSPESLQGDCWEI